MFGRLEKIYVIFIITFLVLFSFLGIYSVFSIQDKETNLKFNPSVPKEYTFDIPNNTGKAFINGKEFNSLHRALSSAESGDTIFISGVFNTDVRINKSNITLTSVDNGFGVINGAGSGDVLTLNGDNITVEGLWVRNSGYETSENDAGVWVNSTNSRLVNNRISSITFGVWIDGVDGVYVGNNTIVGREEIGTLSYRGNGIQVWKTEQTELVGNRVTDVRDGIYFSFASETTARNNTMWDLRYGVHYMYSDDNVLVNNVAFSSDSGWALMVSQDLSILDNTAVNNTGTSGHGILLKDIDDSLIKSNTVVSNRNGFYIYNSLNNSIISNLVLGNQVGIYLTAGSVEEDIYKNSFIGNQESVRAVIGEQVAWNSTEVGNYWSDFKPVDIDEDGVSEIRYQPSGIIENMENKNPKIRVFSNSPAFDIIRLAESSIPIIESPGVVDYHPIVKPRHNVSKYYE